MADDRHLAAAVNRLAAAVESANRIAVGKSSEEKKNAFQQYISGGEEGFSDPATEGGIVIGQDNTVTVETYVVDFLNCPSIKSAEAIADLVNDFEVEGASIKTTRKGKSI